MNQPDFHPSTALKLDTSDQEFYGQCAVCKAWKLVDQFFDREKAHKTCIVCRNKSKQNYKHVTEETLVRCLCGILLGKTILKRHQRTKRHLMLMSKPTQ
jgi:hypothetical protein